MCMHLWFLESMHLLAVRAKELFSLSYAKAKQKTANARLDFIAEDNCQLELELSNDFGYSILSGHLSAEGFFANKLKEEISLSEKGFFIIKGIEIGLHWSEVAMLLGFKIPRDWLDRLMQKSGSESFFVNDKERRIEILLIDDFRYKIIYRWSSYWFLKDHEIQFFFDHQEENIEITLPDDSVLSLKRVHDES